MLRFKLSAAWETLLKGVAARELFPIHFSGVAARTFNLRE
jgi:hypothetical protein